jgi:serine O-acetyltransferase
LHRISSALYAKGVAGKITPKFLWRVNVFLSACHIDPLAKIGGGLKLPHPTGIVIGSAIIGRNANIHQNVTIGVRRQYADDADEIYPVIGNNVTIYAGAVIVGNIKIGNGTTIGANAVVLNDVPAHATAVGVPARIVKHNKARIYNV